jgi:hypothetical protein
MSTGAGQKTDKTSVNQDESIFEVRRPAEKKGSGNPPLGIAAGVGVSIVACVIWILLSHMTKLTGIGIVIAFGIASAIKYVGRPSEMWYGIAGASLSLLVALIGNLSTAVFLYTQHYHKTAVEILSQGHFTYAFRLLYAISGPLDYLMYIAMIVIGYHFAFFKMQIKV